MPTRVTLALSLCSLGIGAVAAADPLFVTQGPVVPEISFLTAPLDGSWVVLDELMPVGSNYAPVFTYTSVGALQIDLTDLFVVSDQNEIYLDGVLTATTPAMPDWQALFPPVGPMDDAPYTADPDVAWTRPEFSKGSYVLPAGSHVLTFRNIHIPLDENGNPFADGTMAFRVVPEPTTAALFLLAGMLAARGRRGMRRAGRGAVEVGSSMQCVTIRYGVLGAAAIGGLLTGSVRAGTPCGPLQADVSSGILEIQGTTGPDNVRIAISSTNSAVVEIFNPATSATPSCSFDSITTPFGTIRVLADAGDDLVVFDDSNGVLSNSWTIIVDGGDDADTVLAGIDLNVVPLSSALSMIATLQQAQNLIDDVLDLLDDSQTGCSTVPCLVTNAATLAKNAGNDLVKPTAHYVRDIETELVQPSAAAVRDAHDRLADYLQTFVASSAQGLAVDAQAMTTNVEVSVDQFELLLPMGQDLLGRAQSLYERASRLGLETQNGDSIGTFISTIESHVTTIEEFAALCAEDPEPTETQFDEDLQDPSGLSFPCAEVERRIEALEAITDDVEARVNQIEADGDQFEADGDAMETFADGVGDDENPSSNAAQIETQGDALVASADLLSAAADAVNTDWETWVGGVETDLESRGATMDVRGQTEIAGPANTLRTQAQTDVETSAAALLAEADQLAADLQALMVVAAPLLRDDLSLVACSGGGTCPVTPTNTVLGGAGNDFLVGTTGSDRIEGGDGNDLIIGAGGADQLLGDDGNDLIFGGGGDDEINGGAKVDILVGNAGNDCIFGGGGQTLTRGSLSVELGDIFFGMDGNDTLVSGDSESDSLTEIDVAFGGDCDDRIRLSHGGTLTVNSFSFQFGNLAFGGGGADDIGTGDGVDVIFGGAGDDTIGTAKGAQLTIGSGSSQFRLALGDLIFGGDGKDTIDSDDSAADRADDDIDVVFGGEGDDTINGYGGGALSIGDVNNPDFELKLGNLIFGGGGEDEITTLDGIDVIFGEGDNDTITTGKGALLTIGSGNNEFRLALGDLIFGGDGNDTIHGDDPAGDRADDDIDVIFGGNNDDEIHGYGGGMLSIGNVSNPDFELRLGNVIFGGDDDDEIDALDGIDLIFAGAGNDTVSAGKGHNLEIDSTFKINLGDLIFGQGGDDTLHGDAADPPSDDAEDGIDVIFGGSGADAVYGGTGGTIELPDQNFCLLFGNLLFGGPDDDTLRGDYLNWDSNDPRGGIDVIFGAGGNDTIEGAAGSLIIIGDITTGQAIVIGFGNILFGGPGNDNIYGADAATVCTGVSDDLDDFLDALGVTDLGGAADLIFCGGGDDVAVAYDGIDFVFGSDGMDNLDGANGGLIIIPISGVPTPIAFGNLMFGGDDDDVIVSLGRVGLITVPPAEIDLLFGGPCDDNISAGDGFNLVFGNRADDTITTSTGLDGINLIFGNSGADTITSADGLNVVFGNLENDTINAGDGINVLFGNRGNDSVIGGSGLNIAFGGKGNDIVQGGLGISILFGNSGFDQVSGGGGLCLAFGNRGDDQVAGGNGLGVLFGNAGNDNVAGGIGLCVAFGNSGHDLVSAGAGLNVLFGNSGEDRLRAGPGVSVQFGNADNDIIEAGGGLLVAFGNRNDDVLVGAGGLNLGFGNGGADQFFGGSGMNILFGNANDDIIRGGSFADILFGNAGADQIAGFGGPDILFGNRDADCLESDGGNDLLFGNRGDDHVRSGSDGECDLLFGNRGNDNLYRCQTCDKRFGGRGSDTKHDDCGGCSFPAPSRGEVRGVVMIDIDGDTIGDIPQAGVTVNAGSSSAVTDADGLYRIANLSVGSHALSQNVPSGFTQLSGPATNPVTIGSMGIDLYQNQNFVNRENCFVSPDAWGCLGTACLPAPPQLECRPIVVRRVMRCPDTGAICDQPSDCPCNDCVPSWAVVECACIDPNTDCYVSFDAAAEPTCGSQCLGNDGVLHACELVQDGDLFHCECATPPPCPSELARFTFTGVVTEVFGSRPPPWNLVNIGQPWSMTYFFIRSTADQNPGDPFVGDYPAITFYQLQAGPAGSGGAVSAASTLIRNNSGVGLSPDRYGVSIPVPVAGPPATANLLLEDPSGSAWLNAGLNPHDALPLCDDIVLSQFGLRILTIGSTVPGGQWQIRGSVTGFECTDCAPPAPFVKPRPMPQGLGADAATEGSNGTNGSARRARLP